VSIFFRIPMSRMSYNGDDDPGFASVAAEVFKLDAMMGTLLGQQASTIEGRLRHPGSERRTLALRFTHEIHADAGRGAWSLFISGDLEEDPCGPCPSCEDRRPLSSLLGSLSIVSNASQATLLHWEHDGSSAFDELCVRQGEGPHLGDVLDITVTLLHRPARYQVLPRVLRVLRQAGLHDGQTDVTLEEAMDLLLRYIATHQLHPRGFPWVDCDALLAEAFGGPRLTFADLTHGLTSALSRPPLLTFKYHVWGDPSARRSPPVVLEADVYVPTTLHAALDSWLMDHLLCQ